MKNPIKTYSVEDPVHPTSETLARRNELKNLTGCSHAYVIDGQCSEPGCFANKLAVGQEAAITVETSLAVQNLKADGADAFSEDIPRPIINTQPRKWCVL